METEKDQSSPEAWLPPKTEPSDRLEQPDFQKWKLATAAVKTIAERDGLSKSEVARRSDVPMGTFSPWYDGSYTGKMSSVTARMEKWISAIHERVRVAGDVQAPGFIDTPTAREVLDTLIYAQALPEMVVITLGPGMGKTITAKLFAATRPHAFLVTMRPTTTKVFSMMQELSSSLGVVETHAGRLDRAIGERLKRNGRHTLLIVDEAQNCEDQAVNQLRHYHDEYGCGIALVGNEELYGRFGGNSPKAAYAQIHRRIGKRLKRLTPQQGDIDAIVAAWKLEDKEAIGLARAIGRKPGALGQITKTLTYAHMLAAGQSKPLSAEHVRAAWMNRGGEDLRNDRPSA
jgi:hypothetical protein